MEEDDAQQYRLVFSGSVRAGFDRDAVIAGLGQLLNVNARQAERLLVGKKQHLRTPLDRHRATALYKQAHALGAECSIRKLRDDSAAPFPSPDSVIDKVASENSVADADPATPVTGTSAASPTRDSDVLAGQVETDPAARSETDGGSAATQQRRSAGVSQAMSLSRQQLLLILLLIAICMAALLYLF